MRLCLPALPRELALGVLALLGGACLSPAACYGQSEPAAQAPSSSLSQAQVDPLKIVQNAAFNEQRASAVDHPFRYRYRKEEDGKTTLKAVIETSDGSISRLLANDGKPLDAEENERELTRLHKLRDDPEAQHKRHKRDQTDGERANSMTQLLPRAFLYTYAGIVDGPSGPCYRLLFEPNPAFVPPSREAEVYHGMAGEMWVDQGQQRLARFQAHLISDVNFGWGVVGRLFKGGTILVEQKDVGGHRWEATAMHLHLSGKILLVKALDIQTDETFTDFEPVSGMTYQAAIGELEKTTL